MAEQPQWMVGYRDRGLGRGDFAVCTLDGQPVKATEENIRLMAAAPELQALFDLQQTRMGAATDLWREHNPGNETVLPDLGKLLEWFIEDRKRLEAIARGYDRILQRRQ